MGHVPDLALSSTEFTNAPVPINNRISWWTIALIKIGVVLALPGFLIGAQIGHSMGLRNGMIAFFGGAAILAIIAMLTATVAAQTHLATSVITQFPFGRVGARVINLILGITLIGWFAVTAEIFGSTLAQMATSILTIHIPEKVGTVIGGLLMVGTTMFGFKAISRLADLAVPLLLILLLVITWLAIRDHSLATLLAYRGTGQTSIGVSISAVVGGASVGTIIFPDIARFARSANHGRGAAVFTYGLCLPLMFVMVAVASVATGERNIMVLMLALGLGGITLAFLVFKAWTTNVANLYSSSLFFSTLLPRFRFRFVVLGVGALGIASATLGLTQHFVPFLLVLGITIPPIAGIYVTDYQLRGRRLDIAVLASNPKIGIPAFCAWGGGIAIAGLSSSNSVLTLTSIPSCDSIIVAAALYAALHFCTQGRSRLAT
ncbi:cytosine permease [Sphingomonas crocodyli]|uniref:Cytosine permease n=1 Tax=Sphingomonas crocodyli TaxID=1979270 RepID=A0A437M5Q2_9SPHN|nr:cytosine permease [Sphingomonas crocodyli]RVT92977.1 hypothetical protein EOD43_03470 [Sphingomonas crocodyli]